MPTFEESLDIIDTEINKRKNRWNLTALAWMDFDDVAQILRVHINKKWYLYDDKKPLAPWLNRIISNQIKNLIRNTYGNFCRPCLRCAAAEGEDGCRIYQKQCSSCPLYGRWFKTKKRAHDTKLPVALELHSQQVNNLAHDSVDVERVSIHLHEHMERVLKPLEWKAYKLLFIDNLDEEEAAKQMGYKTSEKGRTPGYKQIKNIRKAIMIKVKKIVYSGEIDMI
jgi:DNA-directed RNA polymerase specialized sigma24 family protein